MKNMTEKFNGSVIEKFAALSDIVRYRIMVVAGVGQAVFSLIVMILLRVIPLIISCSLGIILFIFCLFLAQKKKIALIYILVLTYGLVSLLIAAFHLEWGMGFQNYLFVLIPLSYTFLYTETNYKKTFLLPFASLAATFSCYIACLLINNTVAPVTGAGIAVISVIKAINALLIMLLLFVFVSMFILRLNAVNKKVQETTRELDIAANTDELTGLYNRHYIQQVIDDILNKKDEFHLVMCDIDHFKAINDTYGHSGGDVVLGEISRIILSSIRKNDYAVRWGGDEFLIVLSEASTQNAGIFVERLLQSVRGIEINYEGKNIKCTITAGIAKHDSGETLDDTLVRSDNNLYKGKAEGRNRYVL